MRAISQAEVEQEFDKLFAGPCLPADVVPLNAEIKKVGLNPGITLEDFDTLRITKEKDIAHPEPIITIAGAAVASPENITAISAAAKAGKTAVAGVILAGAISANGDAEGFPDLKIMPNPGCKAVIDMDTEQSEADQQDNVNTILRRAGLDKTPDHFRAYNIRKLSLNNYQRITDQICELSSERFGGIHLIMIDGGADYISSVNDEETASGIVQYFIGLSIRYKCPVVVIVHQNPGSDKERGHFGSEIQRKCFGLLSIKRDGDISTLEPKIMRKAGNGDIPIINFQYCKTKGCHIQSGAVDPGDTKARKDRERVREIADLAFSPLDALNHADAVSRIMQHSNKGMTTAKTMLGNMVGWNYLEKGKDGFYRKVNKVNEGQNRVN